MRGTVPDHRMGRTLSFDGASVVPYPVQTMPSTPRSKEISARSSLSGRPVGLMSAFAISLLGLLLLLAR
jgi:hypothetical protein